MKAVQWVFFIIGIMIIFVGLWLLAPEREENVADEVTMEIKSKMYEMKLMDEPTVSENRDRRYPSTNWARRRSMASMISGPAQMNAYYMASRTQGLRYETVLRKMLARKSVLSDPQVRSVQNLMQRITEVNKAVRPTPANSNLLMAPSGSAISENTSHTERDYRPANDRKDAFLAPSGDNDKAHVSSKIEESPRSDDITIDFGSGRGSVENRVPFRVSVVNMSDSNSNGPPENPSNEETNL